MKNALITLFIFGIICLPSHRVSLLAGGVEAGEEILPHVKVHSSVIPPKDVSDMFGKRIAKRYAAIQVTVANNNPEYQFLIYDVTIDLTRALELVKKEKETLCKAIDLKSNSKEESELEEKLRKLKKREDQILDFVSVSGGGNSKQFSSVDFRLLRGVAEKGMYLDTRNLFIRFFRGAGSIASALSGFSAFGTTYDPFMSAFNGPFTTTMESVFPDFTVNQFTRLNDSAYMANTLVPRRQAKVMVAFIPLPFWLSPDDMKAFWNDPRKTMEDCCLNFLAASIHVEGTFIEEMSGEPVVGDIFFVNPENFQFPGEEVSGFVLGRYLKDAKVSLDASDSDNPEGITIQPAKENTFRRIDFTLKHDAPLSPGQRLTFVIATPEGSEKKTVMVIYSQKKPVITGIGKNDDGGKTVKLTLQGENFREFTKFEIPEIKQVNGKVRGEIHSQTEATVTFERLDPCTAEKYHVQAFFDLSTTESPGKGREFELKALKPEIKSCSFIQADGNAPLLSKAGTVTATIEGEGLLGSTPAFVGIEEAWNQDIKPDQGSSDTTMSFTFTLPQAMKAGEQGIVVRNPCCESAPLGFKVPEPDVQTASSKGKKR